jgi:hypothetical protein
MRSIRLPEGVAFLDCTLQSPELLAVCGGEEASTDTKVVNKLLQALEKLELASKELSTQVDKGDPTGGKALDLTMEASEALRALSREKVALFNKKWQVSYDKLNTHATGSIEYHGKYIGHSAVATSVRCFITIAQKTQVLKKCSGGLPGSERWYGKAPTNLTHESAGFPSFLKEALQPIHATKTEGAMKDALKTINDLQLRVKSIADFLPLHNVNHKKEVELIVELQDQIVICRITKLEIMLAKVILHVPPLDDEKKTKVVSNLTGAFIRDLSTWGFVLPPYNDMVWQVLADACGLERVAKD